MEFRQMEIFVAVADHKSFSAAAELLHVSQSTISTQILALENELKTELIRRTTRSFLLTDAGARLYTYAVDLLLLRKRAQQEVSENAKKTIEIGTSSVPAVCIVPRLICKFQEKYPDTSYHIVEDNSIQIIDMVSAGKLDLGFVGTKVEAEELSYTPILQDELVIVTPNQPPYQQYQNQQIPVNELLKFPFLMRNHSSGTIKEAFSFLQQIGVHERDLYVIARMNNVELLEQCIIQGLGISILSKNAMIHWIEQKQVLTFPLGDLPSYRQLYLVVRKTRYTPPMMQRLVRFVEREYGVL